MILWKLALDWPWRCVLCWPWSVCRERFFFISPPILNQPICPRPRFLPLDLCPSPSAHRPLPLTPCPSLPASHHCPSSCPSPCPTPPAPAPSPNFQRRSKKKKENGFSYIFFIFGKKNYLLINYPTAEQIPTVPAVFVFALYNCIAFVNGRVCWINDTQLQGKLTDTHAHRNDMLTCKE